MKELIVITEILMPVCAIVVIWNMIRNMRKHDDHGHSHHNRDVSLIEILIMIVGGVGAPALVMADPTPWHVLFAIIFGLYFVINVAIVLFKQPATKNMGEVDHRHWTTEDQIVASGILAMAGTYLLFVIGAGWNWLMDWCHEVVRHDASIAFLGEWWGLVDPTIGMVIVAICVFIIVGWISYEINQPKSDSAHGKPHAESHDSHTAASHDNTSHAAHTTSKPVVKKNDTGGSPYKIKTRW